MASTQVPAYTCPQSVSNCGQPAGVPHPLLPSDVGQQLCLRLDRVLRRPQRARISLHNQRPHSRLTLILYPYPGRADSSDKPLPDLVRHRNSRLRERQPIVLALQESGGGQLLYSRPKLPHGFGSEPPRQLPEIKTVLQEA